MDSCGCGESFFSDAQNMKAYVLQQGHTGFYKTSRDGNNNDVVIMTVVKGMPTEVAQQSPSYLHIIIQGNEWILLLFSSVVIILVL